MAEYGVGPSTKPPWTIDPREFAGALLRQWPTARVGIEQDPDAPILLECLIPSDTPDRELGVDLLRSGQFVTLDPADPIFAADFALWFVHQIPSGDPPIYISALEEWNPLEIRPTTTVAAIVEHLS